MNQLLADARAGNFNAIIVQVRKRGDAYYNSNFEPKATDISSPSYDPLADLVAKAHNLNNGARIEIHAWIVTYPIWGSQTSQPSQPSHPYNLHPDWLTQNNSGATWNGSQFAFDPGHPAVQEHTFNVAMDIISRYDVDGLNFDYVRYAGNTWGYNSNAVARFNAQFNRTGQPATTDPQWLQWRRDQVTALVRKVYLHAIALKPQVKISADTICFAPGVTTTAGWTSSAAYTSVLQDWRAWMEEGILDMAIPMAYFNHAGQYAYSWTNWSTFTKDHRYNRHAVMGPGIYLNSISNALFQMRHTRQPSPSGNRADGVCGYSYAVPTDPAQGGVSRSTFLAALTQTNTARLYDPNPQPIFVSPAAPPVMPWKASPTRGHLKGFVFNGTNGSGFDGATVQLAGSMNRTLLTDASGFYGAVDLPAGIYSVSAVFPGFEVRSSNLVVVAGTVTTLDLTLPLSVPLPPSAISNVVVIPGGRSAIITWQSTNAADSQVEYGLTPSYGLATPRDFRLATNHSVMISGLEPGTTYFFGVVSRAGNDIFRSDGWTFSTAADLVMDNHEATFSGSWSTGTSSADKFGADYRYIATTNGGNTASAIYTPAISVPGNYDVYVWYPQGGNRSTNTPVAIFHNGGTSNVRVNQETGGGGWRLVGSNVNFRAGSSGLVRIGNGTGESDQVVMADAVRFAYRMDQDTPVGPTVPDWWANYYFGSNSDAQLDHDGDGYPDWMEYLAGTVPTDPSSSLRLALQVHGAGTLRAEFSPQVPGRRYQLERQSGDGTWVVVPNLPVMAGPNGTGWITITNSFGPIDLYRLRIDWAP